MFVEQGEAFAKVVVRAAAPGAREIEYRKAELSANTGFARDLGGNFGEKIHITKGGSTAAQHFGNGELTTIAHKIGVYPLAFGGPDVVVKPSV